MPELPPGVVAGGGRGGELPPLLRRERSGGHPHGAAVGLRAQPCATLPALGRAPRAGAAARSHRWALRSARVFREPPAALSCNAGGGPRGLRAGRSRAPAAALGREDPRTWRAAARGM